MDQTLHKPLEREPVGRKGKSMPGTHLYSSLSRVAGSSVVMGHILTQNILRFCCPLQQVAQSPMCGHLCELRVLVQQCWMTWGLSTYLCSSRCPQVILTFSPGWTYSVT